MTWQTLTIALTGGFNGAAAKSPRRCSRVDAIPLAIVASTGPRRNRRGDPAAPTLDQLNAKQLQRGRGEIAAEMREVSAGLFSTNALQRGRGEIAAEIWNGRGVWLCAGGASTGPRRNRRGDPSAQARRNADSLLQRGRGEIAAEIKVPKVSTPAELSLQRGRGEIAAEMFRRYRIPPAQAQASTGPRRNRRGDSSPR